MEVTFEGIERPTAADITEWLYGSAHDPASPIVRLCAALADVRAALREACGELREIGYGEPVYGVFHGGDPRDFTPDEECSTPEEREAHRLACEAAERDEEARRIGSDCHWTNPEKQGRLPGSTFGLGVNQVRADADRYDRWCALAAGTVTQPVNTQ